MKNSKNFNEPFNNIKSVSKTLKLLSISLLLLMSFLSCAQKNEIPEAITNTFTEKFPTTELLKWEKESITEWEATYNLNGIKYTANFDTNGTWLETEHHIKTSEIPQIISNTLKNSFKDYEVDDVEICETPNGIFYEFELENDKDEDLEVVIDSNGKILKNYDEDEDDN